MTMDNKASPLSHIIADFMITNYSIKFWIIENLVNKEITNAQCLLDDELVYEPMLPGKFTVALVFETIYDSYQYDLVSILSSIKGNYKIIIICFEEIQVKNTHNINIIYLDKISNPHDKAQLIHQLKVHLLIYFEYFSMSNYHNQFNKKIYQTLSFKPCDIQIIIPYNTYTRGGYVFDYVLLDRYLFDNTLMDSYKENVIIMDCSVLVTNIHYFYKNVPPEDPRYNIFPNDCIIYANFSDNYKITPDLFDTWLNILKTIPNSVLVLKYTSEEVCNNLYNYTAGNGVEAKRLLFVNLVDRIQDAIKYLYFIDLYLDIPNLNGEEYIICCQVTETPVISLSLPKFRGSGNFTKSLASNLNFIQNTFFEDFKSYENYAVGYFACDRDDNGHKKVIFL
jgi:predicted O-linked N-acetylglucosamine transferase (SPINDLY family)